MSEKKAKENRKEQEESKNKVLVQYVIKGYGDGSVDITGPIDNLLLFREVMCDAEKAVLRRIREKMIDKNRILVPGIQLPNNIRAN